MWNQASSMESVWFIENNILNNIARWIARIRYTQIEWLYFIAWQVLDYSPFWIFQILYVSVQMIERLFLSYLQEV